jgi:L-iditol 2-dehydrogenase
MKSIVLTGLSRIEVSERPVPEIENSCDVLIRMRSVGVCGSDIHYYRTGRIGSQVVQFPFVLGHEGAGVIEKTGSGVTALKPGDRVAIDPAMPCHNCDQCRDGRPHTCRNLRFLGCPGQAEGCLSEYIVMPASSCIVLPENVTLDQGALSEPLSIGLYTVRSAGDIKGKAVGILGSGPIGLSVLQSAVAEGAGEVYVTDKIDERLAVASGMGAAWAGNVDTTDVVRDILERKPEQLSVVFECCGQQEAADQAVQLLKPGGTLMIIGIPEFERWIFGSDDMRRKEISIRNIRRQNESVNDTIQMIASGIIQPDRMQTHNYTLDETAEAFEMVAGYRDGVIKAMIHLQTIQ